MMERTRIPATLSIALIGVQALAQVGAMDPYFGDDGIAIVPLINSATDDIAHCAVVQDDQHILIVGRTGTAAHYDLALFRYTPDGLPDEGFGANGHVVHGLAAGSQYPISAALDASGRIVVGGYLFSDAGNTTTDLFTARFLPDGSLDGSFNASGLLVRSMHASGTAEQGREVLVDTDGRIILVGTTGPGNSTEIFVERYLEDGSLDGSFAGDGSLLPYIDGASDERALAAALDADGNILIAGGAKPTGVTDEALLLAMIDPDGDMPGWFGEHDGYTLVQNTYPSYARAIAVASDGGIILGGAMEGNGEDIDLQHFYLQSVDADGVPGWARTYGFLDANNTVNAVAFDASDRILYGGVYSISASDPDWIVGRDLPDGTSDPSFNGTGRNVLDLDGGEEICHHITLFADGSILGVGRIRTGERDHIALIKYLVDGTVAVHEQGQDVAGPQVMPVPTTGDALLTFALRTGGPLDAVLLDAQGRTVRTLFAHAYLPEGRNRLPLDLSGIAPGSYFVRLTGQREVRTVPLIKQ